MRSNRRHEKSPVPQARPEDEPQAFINIGERTPQELAEELRAFGFAIELIDEGSK